MKAFRIVAVVTLLAAWPGAAQWLKLTTPGVPRNADGKPNLTAPAPKLADGKPDLSGIWNPNPKYLRDSRKEFRRSTPPPCPGRSFSFPGKW
jgi:hypothetical protein